MLQFDETAFNNFFLSTEPHNDPPMTNLDNVIQSFYAYGVDKINFAIQYDERARPFEISDSYMITQETMKNILQQKGFTNPKDYILTKDKVKQIVLEMITNIAQKWTNTKRQYPQMTIEEEIRENIQTIISTFNSIWNNPSTFRVRKFGTNTHLPFHSERGGRKKTRKIKIPRKYRKSKKQYRKNKIKRTKHIHKI